MAFKDEFFEQLSKFRGKPRFGGDPLQFAVMFNCNANDVSMGTFNPDPYPCRSSYFYNTRQNVLYKKKIIRLNYGIWQPIAYF